MPKYLIQSNYVDKGIGGLMKDGGTGRRAAVEEMFKSMGGKLETLYFAFGDTDVFVIGELPDNACATALALKVNAAGAAKCKTTVLVTPEEVDEAVKKQVTYGAPGA